ncbi:MAG: hypothetical protein JXR70_06725 [Spirochaetales bacterium]|nr:hypothetical protein [Spirochaetales bacterium]
MKQKGLILFSVVITVMLLFSCGGGTSSKPAKATPLPASEIEPGAGEMWLGDVDGTATAGGTFTTKLYINTGKQKIAAYGVYVYYDDTMMTIDTAIGNAGISEGTDGFVAAVNPNEPGRVMISGFDVYGKGPGKELHLATINWKAKKAGKTDLRVEVDKLTDETTIDVGNPIGKSTSITIN